MNKRVVSNPMQTMMLLFVHLLVTIAKLLGPGGVKAVMAESLLLKHQLIVVNRTRRKAPNLSTTERLFLGVCSLFIHPTRFAKAAVIVKPSTLLSFHKALVKRKYRLLFSAKRRSKPGPKGPSKEMIQAIVEMKLRNPRYGCPRIAQQINLAFGTDIDKDVVRRVLAKHYHPKLGHDGGLWTSRSIVRTTLWDLMA